MLRTGRIPEADWTKISATVGRLAEAPLYIDDNPHLTVMDMRAKCRRLKSQHGDLDVPVIALAQLNRSPEYRQNERPMLADLRESGALEQDSDVVCCIYRDDTYNPETSEKGIAEIIVAKYRNGPTGKIRLAFLEHLTRFADLARA